MAIADTLTAKLQVSLTGTLARAMGTGGHTGTDVLNHEKTQSFTDGSSANQASGWFSTRGNITTGGITISLGDEADPGAGIGDDTPTSDPDELKLRAIMIENEDATNYVTLGLGTNALTSWLAGTSPTVKIPAGGMIVATFPAGLDAMTDGTDDEIKLTANTATCICKISYLFG